MTCVLSRGNDLFIPKAKSVVQEDNSEEDMQVERRAAGYKQIPVNIPSKGESS